jgi:diacylglycerol kinase (ATP)
MKRLIRSFGFAGQGIGYAIRTQVNVRIHLTITALVIGVGLWLQLNPIEWSILVVMISVVLSAELFNTALEATLDRVSVEEHPLAKIGKDVAAGAVFVCAIGSVIVGLLIFGPRLLALIGMR